MRFLLFLLIITGISFAQEKFNGYIIKLKNEKISAQSIEKRSRYILVKDQTRLKQLLDSSQVEYIEPNYRLKKVGTLPLLEPNDECFAPPGCFFEDVGHIYQWGLYKIRAPESWYELDQGRYSGDTVYIAVLDTGVDYTHPDLAGKVWKNPDEICGNGKDDDRNGFVDDCYGWNAIEGQGSAFDDDGHGTHIAGIISAVADNLVGVAGASWKTAIKIIPCKMLDSSGQGNLFWELSCIDYIKSLKKDKNLNIVLINASYGGEYNSSLEKDAIKNLSRSGILFVTASGNDGTDNEINDFAPCNYDLQNEICVGATNELDKPAEFSNYGKTKVKIFAPGSKIVSTYKDKSYALIDGTSQAAPFVSAVAGMYAFLNPSSSFTDIKNKILLSGKNLSSLDGYSYTCNRLDMYDVLFGGSSVSKICIDTPPINIKVLEGDSLEKVITVRSTGTGSLAIYSISSLNGKINIKDDNCTGKNLDSFEECSFTIYRYSIKNSISDQILIQSSASDRYIKVDILINEPTKILDIDIIPEDPDVDEVVYFSWELENPDNDTLTCKIDIDGDGDFEKIIDDCKTIGYETFRYSEDGKYRLKFVVDDGYEEVEETITVKVGNSQENGSNIGCIFSTNSNITLILILSAVAAIVLIRKISRVYL